jgi:hypothetical protein
VDTGLARRNLCWWQKSNQPLKKRWIRFAAVFRGSKDATFDAC